MTVRMKAQSWPRTRQLCGLLCLIGLGCTDELSLRLDPVVIGLSDDTPAVYDDGELVIYEAKIPLELPVVAPSQQQLENLWQADALEPFERLPWVRSDDFRVQVSYSLTNLDAGAHEIWLMVDPWNEFGRYEPAVVVADEEAVRDFSGIDLLFLLPGTEDENLRGADSAGRVVGTLTFDDMHELAIDLATVFQMLTDIEVEEDAEEDPRSTLVNHAFNVRNRSYNSPLLEPYTPQIVPGLIGFDVGIRTSSPANIALELLIEIEDQTGSRLSGDGENWEMIEFPETVVSSTGIR